MAPRNLKRAAPTGAQHGRSVRRRLNENDMPTPVTTSEDVSESEVLDSTAFRPASPPNPVDVIIGVVSRVLIKLGESGKDDRTLTNTHPPSPTTTRTSASPAISPPPTRISASPAVSAPVSRPSSSDTKTRTVPIMDGKQPGRPRRSIQRRSYAEVIDSDDEDFNPGRAVEASEDDEFSRGEDSDRISQDEEDEETDDDHDVDDSQDEDSENSSMPSRKRQKRPITSKPRRRSVGSDLSHGLGTESEKTGILFKFKEPKGCMRSIFISKPKGIDESLPPMSSAAEIFEDLTRRACSHGLDDVSRGGPLRIATMCSGTEQPLLALQMIRESLKILGKPDIDFEHVFSAEIVPYKQAYIERNFGVKIIFRDITEMTKSTDGTATTAYGAKVAIPGDIHILIAGTSCVDFSQLNRHKKGVDDDGESGDTFRAVLDYVKKFRPRMIILENTLHAPWKQMLAQYEAIGYTTSGVRLDTKDFYLPQTRQRGYMVAIDTLATDVDQESRTGIATFTEDWQNVMEALRRRASSSVSSFLLPDDHGDIVRARHRMNRRSLLDALTTEKHDWSKCELRHRQYRHEKKIGNARPWSSWQESGQLTLADHADTAWHHNQVERIWDFLDCSLLRKALPEAGKYDVRYKTRIWNVSQNIDRFTDTTPFGIAPCLTPSGNFFITDRGGPLTFSECLALQGLPLHKITFTTESEKDVQDLAGNAMSSTTIGAAILATMICASHALPKSLATTEQKQQMTMAKTATISHEQTSPLHLTHAPAQLDLSGMLAHAKKSARLCTCEGQIAIVDKAIQRCRGCGYTVCTMCGGKPVHDFAKPEIMVRETPESFIETWRSVLPLFLRFADTSVLQDLKKEAPDHPTKERYLEVVAKAISHDLLFSRFVRKSHWVVAYESEYARLELAIESEHDRLSWRLFAKAPKDLPGKHALRLFLRGPIARATVIGDALLEGTWEWRVPNDATFKLDISGHSGTVPSWTARLGIPSQEQETVWKELRVQSLASDRAISSLDISGTYEHLPHCGTANEALYKRQSSNASAEPMYLFFDPSRIGAPEHDRFVFSADHARKDYDESREIIASIHERWRPWLDVTKGAEAQIDGQWIPCGDVSLALAEPVTSATIHNGPASFPESADCSLSTLLVGCDFRAQSGLGGQYMGTHTIRPDDKVFFQQFSAFMEPLRQSMNIDEHISEFRQLTSCTTCAPPMPGFQWMVRTSTKGHAEVRPFENPRAATVYERALKKRSEVFTITVTLSSEEGKIDIGLNYTSLVHRALSKLLSLTSDITEPVTVTWKVDAEFFDTSLKSQPAFRLKNNDSEEGFAVQLCNNVALFPKQQQALAWMRQQESGQGRKFTMRAYEESLLPHFGVRAEARAETPVWIRGGILAHHPGFGKTVLCLALIHEEFKRYGGNHTQITRNMKAVTDERTGPIDIAATLIVAHNETLLEQWRGEIELMLGDEYKHTIVIKDMASLKKQTVKSFREARVILVMKGLLSRDTYVKHVAAFAGVPYPGSSRRREFKAWLERTTAEVHKHREVRERHGVKQLATAIRKKQDDMVDDPTMESFVLLSKRLKGAAYVKKKAASKQTNEPNRETQLFLPVPSTRELEHYVFFEMFRFNRLIVDEFSYLLSGTDESLIPVQCLVADKKWCLSGTPPLNDTCDVSKIALLLGVQLPHSASIPGTVSLKNMDVLRKDRTDVEQFEAMRVSPSSAYYERLHHQAQCFLDAFARQSILRFDDHPYRDNIVPVVLNTDHRIVYAEQLHRLSSQDMRIKKSRKASAEVADIERLNRNATIGLKNDATAEDVLLQIATACGEVGVCRIMDRRQEELRNAEESLERAIVISQKLDNDLVGEMRPFELWKRGIIHGNELSDQKLSKQIAIMIRNAESEHPRPAKPGQKTRKRQRNENNDDDDAEAATKKDDWEGSKDPILVKNREQTTETDTIARRYLTCKQSSRFVQNVYQMQLLRTKNQTLEHCDYESCNGSVPLHNVSISSSCGHVACDDCYKRAQEHLGRCGAAGCRTATMSYSLIRTTKLGDINPPKPLKHDLGRKVHDTVTLLQDIRDQSEQALLFVRLDSQLDRLEKVLNSNGITCVSVDNNASAKQITAFQEDPTITCLILNADNESAAGTNLTCANHVIFLSPLLKDDQYGYESQMAQAIGRVRRHGQKKENIYVYRMVALDTIDVDILEHRERLDRAIPQIDKSAIFASYAPDNDEAEPDTSAQHSSAKPFTNADAVDRPERAQFIKDPADGTFKLVPKSLLLEGAAERVPGDWEVYQGKTRVQPYEDFSSLVKFSKAYSEND